MAKHTKIMRGKHSGGKKHRGKKGGKKHRGKK